MAREQLSLVTFNRGVVSRLALARHDVKRVAMAAAVQTNFIPRTLGPASLRPGFEFLGVTGVGTNGASSRMLPFIFSTTDTALVEMAEGNDMRVWIDDAVLTRPTVTTTMMNDDFSSWIASVSTISNGSPGVVTYTSPDSFANGDSVIFTTTGTLPAPLAPSTQYFVININTGANTFNVSLTRGGSAINTTTAGSGTHTVHAVLNGWTNSDESGAVSDWVSLTSGYAIRFIGTGTARAIRDQTVTVLSGGVEHALRVIVPGAVTVNGVQVGGPVSIRVGTSTADDSYIRDTVLWPGEHSLAFTPTGNFNIRFYSDKSYYTYVQECSIEAAGTVVLPHPYANADLVDIRHAQSADIIYLACVDYPPMMIQRRGTGRSWSLVVFQADDGPFKSLNVSSTTLAPTAISGVTTITASKPYFRTTHVGGLIAITSVGQLVTKVSSTSGEYTASIRVTGIAPSRTFAVIISGNLAASTVDLQRSYDDATWANVGGTYVWTADTTESVPEALDNIICFYRLKLTTYVDPGAGQQVTMTLSIGSGSSRGVCRIITYTSPTSVTAEVLDDFGGTTASEDWQEGMWSEKNGYPGAVELYDGRLWWTGSNGIWGSISDAYDSYNELFLGDAGPINRTIGSGPVDRINWILPLQRMVIGTQGSEVSIRTSSLDEPLTPTNFSIKSTSTQGSGDVQAVKVDQQGYFVDRSSIKVFELGFAAQSYDYGSTEITALCPEFLSPGIIKIDVQRKPDTRLHCVRSDGTVALAVFNKQEEQLAWVDVTTDGLIKDVCVLPAETGDVDDRVYYVVQRTISGVTRYYLERWAQEVDCRGGTLNLQGDSFVTDTSGLRTITGLDHLEGEEVVVWADGEDVGTVDTSATWTQTYTVSSGAITLAQAASNVMVGLPYTGLFQSTKLGVAVQGVMTPLNAQKRIDHLGLILAWTHKRGLRFGPDFDHMDDMPLIESGTTISTETPTDYDQGTIPFPGIWTSDSRVCLKAVAPRPCTILAATMDMKVNP